MKLALITGGSRGLGAALVETYLQAGWEVREFSRSGTSAIHRPLDLASSDSIQQAIKSVQQEFASVKLGASWNFMLTVITPLSLLLALGLTLKSIMAEGYGGYAASTLWMVGGGVMAFFILGAILFSLIKDRHS